MSKESREEVLERILEETARNPYKPANKKASRSDKPKTEKPVRKEYVQRTQVFSSAEAQEALQAEIEAKKKPRRTAAQRVDYGKTEAPVISQRQPERQQEITSRVNAEESVSVRKEDNSARLPKNISVEDKINKIKREKAAAAKAAIMKKAELENVIKAQETELSEKSDEKVNLLPDSLEQADKTDTLEKSGISFLFEAIDLFQYAVCIFFSLLVLFNYIFNFVGVSGESMSPTLSAGDELLVQSVGYDPQRNDVVIIDNKTAAFLDEDKNVVEKSGLDCRIVKRIIAVGGDIVHIDFEKGTVVVNGQTLEEEYISEPTTRNEGAFEYPLTVPSGYVFVLGDNRNVSKDSRHGDVGLIPEDEILGKAIFKIYPFGSFGSIE